MSKQNKILVWVVAVLVVVGAVYTITTNKTSQNDKQETIKIGVILPLTGDMAHLGEGVKNSLTLAMKDKKTTKYKYDVVYEDDQLNPKMTASAVNKLINIDKVSAVISFTSGSGNVVTPVAETNKVVHFGIASDANIAKGEYNFMHWTPPSEEAKLVVEEFKKRGIKKIATIALNQQGAKAIDDEIREHLKDTDISIVQSEWYNSGEKDFKTIITRIQQKNPDIIYILAFSPELEIITKQIKDLGITTPLTSIEAFSFSNQKELIEGCWYVDAANATDEFRNKFNSEFNKEVTPGAPNTYDVFNLFVYSTEKVGKDHYPSTGEIAKALQEITNFEGVLGPLSVDKDGIVISRASVYEIKNGKQIPVK